MSTSGATCRASDRSRSMVARASSESAGSDKVTWSSTRPSTTVGSGSRFGPSGVMPSGLIGACPLGESLVITEMESTPGSAAKSPTIASSSDCSTITVAGLPDPAGKWRASAIWPSRAWEALRTRSVSGTPRAWKVVAPNAPTSRATVVRIQMGRERRSTNPTVRPQMPVRLMCSSPSLPGSNRGMRGQNATRPNRPSRAGSRVRAASMAKTMPMAVTGPSTLLDFRSLSTRQSNPAITVPPEAATGSTVPSQAFFAACHLSEYCRSSSR